MALPEAASNFAVGDRLVLALPEAAFYFLSPISRSRSSRYSPAVMGS